MIYAIEAIIPDFGPYNKEHSIKAGICQVLGRDKICGEFVIVGINTPAGSMLPTMIIIKPASAPLNVTKTFTGGLQL